MDTNLTLEMATAAAERAHQLDLVTTIGGFVVLAIAVFMLFKD